MVCRITSTKRRQAGILLSESLVAMIVVSALLIAVAAFMVHSTRSFVTMFNYVDLDDKNRVAMDRLTRDVRQCNRVKYCTSTDLVLEDANGAEIRYYYDPYQRRVKRLRNGAETLVLEGCDRLSFVIGQRNPVNGTYDIYPAADANTAKVINVSWLCSRTIFGRRENTESVQTARIVIRKQGT